MKGIELVETDLVVFGGRDFNDREALNRIVLDYIASSGMIGVSIVSGMARGADLLAYQFARDNNIACYTFPADWNRYGKRAGYVRNEVMANFADSGICFWDGKSRGTAHMIGLMETRAKPLDIYRY